MTEAKTSQLASSIDRYCTGKENLEKVLAGGNEQEKASSVQVIRQADAELEKAFMDLLATTPNDLSEVVNKSRLLISEVLSEAEVTRYQALALQCVIDDLAVFLAKPDKRLPTP